MPWVRLEDDWYDDSELSDAHPLSVLLWVAAISWSARNLKDGLIPAGKVDTLVNWRRAGVPDPAAHVEELVALGKWSPVPSGAFQISNYHQYQPSRADVLAKREQEATRKRSAASPKNLRTESARNPHGSSEDSARNPAHPVPVPEVVTSQSVTYTLPDDLWTAFARRKRSTVREPVRSPARYDATVIANAKADPEFLDRAARWWETFDITPDELAAALIDGQAGRSWQRRREAS